MSGLCLSYLFSTEMMYRAGAHCQSWWTISTCNRYCFMNRRDTVSSYIQSVSDINEDRGLCPHYISTRISRTVSFDDSLHSGFLVERNALQYPLFDKLWVFFMCGFGFGLDDYQKYWAPDDVLILLYDICEIHYQRT